MSATFAQDEINVRSRLSQIQNYQPPANEYACLHMETASATTISVIGTAVKAAGTTAEVSSSSNLTVSTSNRITYTGKKTRVFKVDAVVSMTISGSTDIVSLFFALNGVIMTPSEQQRKVGTGSDIGNAGITCMPTLNKDDYIEVWTTNNDATGTVTLDYVNMNIISVD
jgi:hypothetical protein